MAAKLYGLLIGTTVQTLKSGVSTPRVPRLYQDSFDVVLARDYVTLAGNLIGDQISFGSYRSNTFMDTQNCNLFWDPLGAACTLNIGDLAHPTGIRTALAVAAVGNSPLFAAPPAAQIAAPLWQRLGWGADPGGMIELLGTFAGANPAAGNVAWQLIGRSL
jgi:hypothetical protein